MDYEQQDIAMLHDELNNRVQYIMNFHLKKNIGMSYSEWKLLLAVMLAEESPNQENIATLANKTPAAVSRQLALMIERDLIERSSTDNSKRINKVILTKEGKRLVNKGAVIVGKISRHVYKQLHDDLDPYRDCVTRLLEYLDGNNLLTKLA